MQARAVNFHLKSDYLTVPIANLKAFFITATTQEAMHAIKLVYRKVRAVIRLG